MLRLPPFFIPLLLALLVGCGSQTEESNKLTKEQVETRLAALSCPADEITLPDGPTGGTFRFNSLETPNSLDPAWIRDTASSDIGTSIHEGLIEFDPVDMSVKPC
ncbi:MAG: hypothetical protein KC964_16410, partial [Candidatus Omnitrophica bacterium]|nr:hypothetical protein [Candidatus Omnitrophota bacterium]